MTIGRTRFRATAGTNPAARFILYPSSFTLPPFRGSRRPPPSPLLQSPIPSS